MALHGLDNTGHHGEMTALGVPRTELPQSDEIQILTAQFATKPLMEDVPVGTDLVIGPNAKKPPVLDIPLFVSDMSFGALSEEAKIALARGAELAGTGICSGQGGMLPEEQQNNSRYFYELASAMFGYGEDQLSKVQAFHFKAGREDGDGRTLAGIQSDGTDRQGTGTRKGTRRHLTTHLRRSGNTRRLLAIFGQGTGDH